MILPIVAYGNPVLRKLGATIDKQYPNLDQLIANMFETMYEASGVGLAAPQIGLAIRLFVVDASPFGEDKKDDSLSKKEKDFLKTFKKVFINAQITSESGNEWKFNEGCLSIPKVREDVMRKPNLKISYLDENFAPLEEEYSGIAARIIQHEYDHIEGKLFVDKVSPLRKRLLQGKLNDIMKGKVDVDYKMKFTTK